MRIGDKVEIIVEKAGALEHPSEGRFAGTVERGTIGTFEGPHGGKLPGWFMIRVERPDGILYVPLSAKMFRPVA